MTNGQQSDDQATRREKARTLLAEKRKSAQEAASSASRKAASAGKKATRRSVEEGREKTREAAQESVKRGKARTRKAARRAVKELAEGDAGGRKVDKKTKDVAKRAQESATVRAPMGGSLRTVGDERVVSDMARASAAGDAGLLTGAGLTFSMDDGRQEEAGGGEPTEAFDSSFVGGWGGEEDEEEVEGGEGALEFDDPFGLSGGDR